MLPDEKTSFKGILHICKAKRNKWKRVLNQPRLNSAIDFRPLAVLELTKVNEKQRLAQGGFEPAQILVVQCSGPKC